MRTTRALAWLAPLAIALLAIAGCRERPPPVPAGRDAGPPIACEGRGAGIACIHDVAWQCDDAQNPSMPVDCAERGERCVTDVGCRACVPNAVTCDGDTIVVCDPDGTTTTRGSTCDASAGLRCSPEGCVDLCARAAEERSYVGCEYWAATTRNEQLAPEFSFALAIANPQLVPAIVVVTRAGEEAARRTIAPGALEIVELPWVEALRTPGPATVRVADGAYHVTSDVPVLVTQFNPLQFRIARDCAGEAVGRDRDLQCHSFTNDASLLLPVHVLTGSYVVVARPTFFVSVDGGPPSASPGFAAIVGAGEGVVHVEITSSANVAADAGGAFAAMAPGDVRTIDVLPGEVVQLASAGAAACPGTERTETVAGMSITYCDPGEDFDLTGTILRADGPIAVIAGHDCTFVPFDRWACDHLEEQLFPVESLGRSAMIAATDSIRGEPNLLRIVSAADANTITLTPPLAPPRTLGIGEHVELEIREGVRVEGTGALLASLFLVGQDYGGVGTAGSGGIGDPSMSLAIPDAQYRRSYVVLAPASYSSSFLDVIAPEGLRVELDATIVTGWRPITGTGWSVASVRVMPGVHRLDAQLPFGVQVYGFGSYTSYLVPGGLDLRPIAPPI